MKQSILFIHGFPFSGSSWQLQKNYFQTRFDIFTPDLRGHGKNKNRSGAPWMIQHFCEDLFQQMDELGKEKFILCGLSMGGYMALEMVLQQPQRIEALILCDTKASADGNEAKQKRFETIKKLETTAYFSTFAKEFSGSVLSEESKNTHLSLLKEVEQMILDSDAASARASLVALAARKDQTENLAKISCPTLIVCGEEDKITPPSESEKMQGLIKNSQFVLLKNAGHLSNQESPEAFNKALENFLLNKN